MRKCSKISAILFGPEALNLQELERGGRKLFQQQVAPLAGTALRNLCQHVRQALADSRNVGDLAFGIAQNVDDALRVAFHRGRAVAIAADAKPVLARDFHQIGRFPEHARDFLVLQVRPPFQLYRVGLRGHRRYCRALRSTFR